jgi:hypothetical protein
MPIESLGAHFRAFNRQSSSPGNQEGAHLELDFEGRAQRVEAGGPNLGSRVHETDFRIRSVPRRRRDQRRQSCNFQAAASSKSIRRPSDTLTTGGTKCEQSGRSTTVLNVQRAEDRAFYDHGWLRTSHSFSFADYYDSQNVNWGALRVFNDDRVSAGQGLKSA